MVLDAAGLSRRASIKSAESMRTNCTNRELNYNTGHIARTLRLGSANVGAPLKRPSGFSTTTMDRHHMPPSPGADLGTPRPAAQQLGSPVTFPTSSSTETPTLSNHRGSEQSPLSGDFSAQLDNSLSLQLPPLKLSFPDDTATELPPIQAKNERPAGSSAPTLPPISSVTGTQAHAPLPKPPETSPPPPPLASPPTHWPSLNPFTTYYKPSYLDPVESSPSATSDQGSGARARSVTLDDPDVRIAAEALGQMKTDFSSSRSQSTSLSSSTGNRKPSKDTKKGSVLSPKSNGSNRPEPEPLLSLITTAHPLLASAVEGAASVYIGGKNYSPHIKTGAEYVESYLRPVGKAVGTVSRKTGVEGGVRWIFGMRNRKQQASSDIEAGERGNSKRRKSDVPSKGEAAADAPPQETLPDYDDRRMSISTVDTLPAYDDHRSPAYSELPDYKTIVGQNSSSAAQPWGQKLVVTTSGLGVAMKQESLRSLRYCLKVVRDTNGYISEVLVKLKSVLDEYDSTVQKDGEDHAMEDGDQPASQSADNRSKLLKRMSELREDLFSVIHRTVQTISKYAGGALPENARNLVHRQLMSLPSLYQFHYVREKEGRRESSSSPESLSRDSAHLALLFAKEALHMMTQVGEVLNRTLVSAEEWCETLYKQKAEQSQSPPATSEPATSVPPQAVDREVTMSG
ncbi:hypothetical protein VTJ49DRAFT_4219 [Mycothermus thermophilus]|uniref:Clock-controlled protein 8 n=1 Tax=Humicola insolens TaxID=85995 RepID=A0ABR3V5V9_HUMIN